MTLLYRGGGIIKTKHYVIESLEMGQDRNLKVKTSNETTKLFKIVKLMQVKLN